LRRSETELLRSRMSELDTSGSVEGLGRATSPVYSTTCKRLLFLTSQTIQFYRKFRTLARAVVSTTRTSQHMVWVSLSIVAADSRALSFFMLPYSVGADGSLAQPFTWIHG
jgi:hypothetical protein